MPLSTISLLEMAFLLIEQRIRSANHVTQFLTSVESDPRFRILPISADIAVEAAALHTLRDPFDEVIAATARVHRLRLVTSDQRVIASQLVPIIH